MALTTTDHNNWRWIRGADARNSALPLGPTASCFRVGRHYVGVNATWDQNHPTFFRNPIFIRTYFDSSALNLNNYSYIGYVRTLEPKVLGTSVPPKVFGGELGRLPTLFHNSVVDFMGPGDARARESPSGPIPPMYPFNAMLRTNENRLVEYGRTTSPLGFIQFPTPPANMTGTNVALAASAIGQLNMSFLTPDILLGTNVLEPAGGNVKSMLGPIAYPMTFAEFAQKTLVQHAIDLLRADTTAGFTAQDKTISIDHIRFARFVGGALLLTIANDEFMDPVLLVQRETTTDATRPVSITLSLVNYDVMEDKEELATYYFLRRVADHRRSSGITDNVAAPSSARGRGNPLPLPVADQQQVAVITVSDVVYGMPRQITRNSRPTAIEGVTYDVRFIFDAASRKIQYDGVGNARATDQLSAADNAITTYYALVDTEANATVDTTNFELVGIPRFEPIPTPPA